MKNPETLIEIFNKIKVLSEREDNPQAELADINKIPLYCGAERDYFTAEVAGKNYKFHCRSNHCSVYDIKIPEREELLIIDAFEDLYIKMYKKVNKAEIEYEKKIDRLFKEFLNRRKTGNVKEYLQASKLKEKIYI